MVSRRTLPAMQSSHSLCTRFYRWTARPNAGGQARVDLRPTRLRPQGRLFEGKNISVPENALIQFHAEIRSFGGGIHSITLGGGSLLGRYGFRAVTFRIHVSEFGTQKNEL